MRVVVTGGSGMIGRSLAAELAGAGHEVLVTSRHPDGVAGLPAGVRVARWDTASAQELVELVEGAGAVVHLTGEGIADGRWTAERKRRIRASRVDSTAALAQACTLARQRPGVVVQASGIDYYGARGDEVSSEESPPGEGFLAVLCRDWEAASAPLEELGVRRVLLRTGLVLSADGGALPRMALPFRLFAGGPVAGGQQWMSWIHIADEVGAIRFLLEEPAASGAYNGVAPGPVRNGAFSRALGRALRRPSVVPVPALALRLLYGEMATLLVEGQRALPRRLLEAGYVFRHPDVDEALVDLLG